MALDAKDPPFPIWTGLELQYAAEDSTPSMYEHP
jgi:hypothetical protein